MVLVNTACPGSGDGGIPGADLLHADEIANRRDHTAFVQDGMIDDGSGGQGHDAKVDELIAALASFEPGQLDRMAADVDPRQQGLATETREALQKSHG